MRGLVGRVVLVLFLALALVATVILPQVFAGSSQISSKEVLSLVCPTKLTTSSFGNKKELVCPVCPKFTSSAGENDDFSITQILEGNFLPGQSLIFVSYFGCESRARNFGGNFFISKKNNQVLNIEDEFGALQSCKVQPGKDRDQLVCDGKFVCQIENNMKFTCKKQKGAKKK